jgi:hypothetical protein
MLQGTKLCFFNFISYVDQNNTGDIIIITSICYCYLQGNPVGNENKEIPDKLKRIILDTKYTFQCERFKKAFSTTLP